MELVYWLEEWRSKSAFRFRGRFLDGEHSASVSVLTD